MQGETLCNTVLVVEDDPDILMSLRSALEFEGYNVATACNGQEGLNAMREIQKPCLILLDMMMPVMDGRAFLSAKMSEDMFASIPVVVVSAAGERSRNPSAQGFITKPIDLDMLLNTVEQYCPKN